ncbi:hypothetical protein [Actinomycetospora callitridis]|uniref:hypothetical protein n=1 Tax=Actinomycetospora callitridis TaxID=913944 RepID=UPI00236507B0|nr:hypothetical protein [Actinomycetospora callitridis]MDD7917532.1 hypothetical protein [Actinomycetospora callitridis]
MGERAGRDGRAEGACPGTRLGGLRGAALLLTLGVLAPAFLAGGLLLGTAPASAADPVPAVPAPYGGQLDAPDPGGMFDDEQVLEVAMLGLGSLNGLAVAGVLFVNRRGSAGAALETRRALMARTDRGVPSGPRGPARRWG